MGKQNYVTLADDIVLAASNALAPLLEPVREDVARDVASAVLWTLGTRPEFHGTGYQLAALAGLAERIRRGSK